MYTIRDAFRDAGSDGVRAWTGTRLMDEGHKITSPAWGPGVYIEKRGHQYVNQDGVPISPLLNMAQEWKIYDEDNK